ncbi:MAG: response regulator transcription factor [Planctomycetes bacterium]|nr:response regulator transcription factor [Planctomycetota bacterium]
MARILLVEDELRMAHALLSGLREETFLVDHVANARDALVHLKITSYDLAVVDRRLPDLSGVELLKRLRAAGSRLPCLMLTACDAPSEIVEGLDAGADDYVAKPVRFAVLLARIRALLRRAGGTRALLRCGDLELDPVAHQARRGERKIELPLLEYRLLEHLMLHLGEVQSRAKIALAIWPDGCEPPSNVLEVLVSHLRRKIEHEGESRLLHTRRGQGYVLGEDG